MQAKEGGAFCCAFALPKPTHMQGPTVVIKRIPASVRFLSEDDDMPSRTREAGRQISTSGRLPLRLVRKQWRIMSIYVKFFEVLAKLPER